jgi:hypothetical protein
MPAYLQSPVLFLVFNRLDLVKRVFESIRAIKPARLYVASDGARLACVNESDRVKAVRKYIANEIDWKCEVNTLFRDKNLGCRKAVEGAITWFFQHEPMGIILEDDCLPHASFFHFCEELLEKYQADTRVMTISGDNFQPYPQKTDYSYYFSRYPHCWGWATWARAWNLYDGDMSLWPKTRSQGQIKHIFDNPFEAGYWENRLEAAYNDNIDTWAYRWALSCWLQSGLTILPEVNLVSNIGFEAEATHTPRTMAAIAAAAQALDFPLVHPPYLVRDTVADRITYERVYSFRSRLARKVKGLIRLPF